MDKGHSQYKTKTKKKKKSAVFKNTDVKKVFMCSRQHVRDAVNTAPIFRLHRTKKNLKELLP